MSVKFDSFDAEPLEFGIHGASSVSTFALTNDWCSTSPVHCVSRDTNSGQNMLIMDAMHHWLLAQSTYSISTKVLLHPIRQRTLAAALLNCIDTHNLQGVDSNCGTTQDSSLAPELLIAVLKVQGVACRLQRVMRHNLA